MLEPEQAGEQAHNKPSSTPLVEYVQLTSLYAAHLASLYTNRQLHLSLSMSEQTHGNVPAAPCPIMRSVRRQ